MARDLIMLRFCAAILAMLLLVPAMGQARPVNEVPPEEMESNAGVVCNGTVLSMEETGIKRDVSFPAVLPVFHLAQVKAHVKTLHVFKGQVPADFDLFYETLDMAKYPQMMGDAPERIYLQKGGRYRFFLKPDNGAYIGVLDGSLDDGFAAEKLWPHESDVAPYLKASEAIKIARDYITAQLPGDTAEGRVSTLCDPGGGDGATWSVLLHETNDPRSRYCAISVRYDRTVDPANSKLWDLPQ
jgi:hypothetical protein